MQPFKSLASIVGYDIEDRNKFLLENLGNKFRLWTEMSSVDNVMGGQTYETIIKSKRGFAVVKRQDVEWYDVYFDVKLVGCFRSFTHDLRISTVRPLIQFIGNENIGFGKSEYKLIAREEMIFADEEMVGDKFYFGSFVAMYEALGKSSIEKFPHVCPACGNKAYIGFVQISCTGIGCSNFSLS